MGLICAALIGGPIAKFLIDRKKLTSTEKDEPIVGLPYRDKPKKGEEKVDHINIMRAMLATHIAVICGYIANEEVVAPMGFKLPLFVPTLLIGIVMSNTIPYLFPRLPWPASDHHFDRPETPRTPMYALLAIRAVRARSA